MNRKTLTAFAVFAVLLVIAIATLRQPQKGERRGEAPRPIAKLKNSDFDTLEVTKAKVTTAIRKEGGKYKVVSPTPYVADENNAKQAFEAIEKLEFGDIVTDQKSKHGEFEVADDGLRVVAKNGNKSVAELLIGKSIGSGTMVRVPGKDEVWQAQGAIKYTFDKSSADWRDKSITTFTLSDAEKIEVKSKTGGAITLSKPVKKEGDKAAAGADDWAVVSSSVPIPKLDPTIASTMASTLASWKASDFADDVKPEAAGLAPPALTVTVSLKGGKTAVAMVGNKKGDDDYYVKNGESPQIFVVKKYGVEHVNRRPIEFRDKTICDIADSDLTEIAVSHGAESYTLVKSGKDWKATKPPKTEVDGSKVTPIAGAFKAWKATSFAEDPSLKADGLVKPKATIVARSKGATCTLKVGDETKDKQSYFVQAGTSPDVYLVAKWSADRILVKVADIKKTTVAKQ
ncbi:MAG TPA: DUF4340 domain-containing protein [Polyangia bacterium]|nr:DUF4340 domain-containing protein [Polyangia bacterium]